MSIDRKKFMMLALSMSMGAAACGPKSPPPAVTPGNTAEEKGAAPADEGMMPADECTNWDASGECIEWGGAGPANECVNWDASGECIEWM